jgi:hypothetical protein
MGESQGIKRFAARRKAEIVMDKTTGEGFQKVRRSVRGRDEVMRVQSEMEAEGHPDEIFHDGYVNW